ncbi:MAG: Ldh family oxidoreductase [Rhodobacteraceae bacterium]|nr:Ldh family oxidoreductase [Paracoccaceae bacterium]
MRVSVDEIRTQSRLALENAGATPWVAESVANAVAHAEAHGNVICGLYYLESYCVQLRSGRVKGDVEPVVSQPSPAAVLSDAGFGFAQAAFARGLPTALETAQSQGIAIFSVAHAHTCTSLGYFTEQIARAGMIAIGATNASAIVAPPGGARRTLGTNPFAFSVPGPDGLALHYDSSTSAVALGKITMAKAAGESIPEGWAVDADGQPTTDPEAALKGSLVSAAGYKGWGLGLLVEVLASALTGSVSSRDVVGLKVAEGKPHDLGQTYILVRTDVFASDFADKLADLQEAVAADPVARLPGAGRAPMSEIDVPDALWTLTQSLAA